MPLFLPTVWSYCKKYWWIVAAIVGFILLRRWMNETADLAKTLDDIQKAHEEELKKIREADEERRKATQENIKKMQERLAAVEKQYEDAQEDLDEAKKAEIKRILEKDADDPEALAKKLSETTGFRIILPS